MREAFRRLPPDYPYPHAGVVENHGLGHPTRRRRGGSGRDYGATDVARLAQRRQGRHVSEGEPRGLACSDAFLEYLEAFRESYPKLGVQPSNQRYSATRHDFSTTQT